MFFPSMLQAKAPRKVTIVSENITRNTVWTDVEEVVLVGNVYVKSGTTLTLSPGTIVRGDKATKGTLIVARGAKIVANGTASAPIVFTSLEDRPAPGDWGGVVILGRASTNQTFQGQPGIGEIGGGLNNRESQGLYGGGIAVNNADNSGSLRYVRIEYAGASLGSGYKPGGLTLGGVGTNTSIEYVQVSDCAGDAFQWLGGTVNCRYLISYRCADDDFETSCGYFGQVQFGLTVRDPNRWDTANGGMSNGVESLNETTGAGTLPKTRPVFSNLTIVGPDIAAQGSGNRQGLGLHRNTELGLYNSVVVGAWTESGVRLDGDSVVQNAQDGRIDIRNTFIAGSNTAISSKSTRTFDANAWFNAPTFGNRAFGQASALALIDPTNIGRPNPMPRSNSPLLQGANFSAPRLQSTFFEKVSFSGAFGPRNGVLLDWTCGWAMFSTGLSNCNSVATREVVSPFSGLTLSPSVTAGTTQLQFALAQPIDMQLSIVSATGAHWSLNPKQRLASGDHQIPIELGSLPAGQYWVMLRTKDYATVVPVLRVQ